MTQTRYAQLLAEVFKLAKVQTTLAADAKALLRPLPDAKDLTRATVASILTSLQVFAKAVNAQLAKVNATVDAFNPLADDDAVVAAHPKEMQAMAARLTQASKELARWQREARDLQRSCDKALQSFGDPHENLFASVLARVRGYAKSHKSLAAIADQILVPFSKNNWTRQSMELSLNKLEAFAKALREQTSRIHPLRAAVSEVADDKACVAAHAGEFKEIGDTIEQCARAQEDWSRTTADLIDAYKAAHKERFGELREYEQLLVRLEGSIATELKNARAASKQATQLREHAVVAALERDEKSVKGDAKAIGDLLPPVFDAMGRMKAGMDRLTRLPVNLSDDNRSLHLSLDKRFDELKVACDDLGLFYLQIQRERVQVQNLEIRPLDLGRAERVLGVEPGSLKGTPARATLVDIQKELDRRKLSFNGKPATGKILVKALQDAKLL